MGIQFVVPFRTRLVSGISISLPGLSALRKFILLFQKYASKLKAISKLVRNTFTFHKYDTKIYIL